MHYLIVWSGFLGAWLLLAGPIYQAALELEDENIERDELAAASQRVTPPARLSPWWWLLPPVAFVLQRRRSRAYRSAVLQVLAPGHVEQLIRFGDKATGWGLVAFGAFFIGIKETGELIQTYDGPAVLLGLVVVGMVVLCAGYTVVRMRRSHARLTHPRPGTPASRDAGATGTAPSQDL